MSCVFGVEEVNQRGQKVEGSRSVESKWFIADNKTKQEGIFWFKSQMGVFWEWPKYSDVISIFCYILWKNILANMKISVIKIDKFGRKKLIFGKKFEQFLDLLSFGGFSVK